MFEQLRAARIRRGCRAWKLPGESYFIHNPKCGGTSLRTLLGCKGPPRHELPEAYLSEKRWERSTIITAVRHPLDRLISSYRYHTSRSYGGYYLQKYAASLSGDVEAYLSLLESDPGILPPQIRYAYYRGTGTVATHVLRVETLEKDLQQINHLSLAQPERLNISSKQKLDPRDLDLMAEFAMDVFGADYKAFGYDATRCENA